MCYWRLTGVVVLTFLEPLKGVLSALGPYSGEATIESKSSWAYLSVLYALFAILEPAVITLLKFWNSLFNPPFWVTAVPPLLLPFDDLGLDLDRLEAAFFLETALFCDYFLVSSFSCDLLVSIARLALAPRLLKGLWWTLIVSSLLTAKVWGTLPGERTNSLLFTDGLWVRSLTMRFEKSSWGTIPWANSFRVSFASASKSKRLMIAITCYSLAGTPILKLRKRLRFLWSTYL